MLKYKGGETVKPGFYWNRGAWGVELIPAGGGTLPGAPETVFMRVPWPLLLVMYQRFDAFKQVLNDVSAALDTASPL